MLSALPGLRADRQIKHSIYNALGDPPETGIRKSVPSVREVYLAFLRVLPHCRVEVIVSCFHNSASSMILMEHMLFVGVRSLSSDNRIEERVPS